MMKNYTARDFVEDFGSAVLWTAFIVLAAFVAVAAYLLIAG